MVYSLIFINLLIYSQRRREKKVLKSQFIFSGFYLNFGSTHNMLSTHLFPHLWKHIVCSLNTFWFKIYISDRLFSFLCARKHTLL